jgi:nucleotide-binding universal stress UspA family protein
LRGEVVGALTAGDGSHPRGNLQRRRCAMSGIVVGVDGSLAGTAAARWAAREAAMRDVGLTVVHAVRPTLGAWPGIAWPATALPPEFGEQEIGQGEKIIEDTLEVIAKTTGPRKPRHITSRLCFSAVVPTLMEFTEKAQMIVVGRRGQGGLRRGVLGSASSAVVHTAHCPVAVIHHDAPCLIRPDQAPVVVGVDGSRVSELATAIAFEEASHRGVDLIALHAVGDRDSSADPCVSGQTPETAAEGLLADRLLAWQQRYPGVTVRRLINVSDPAPALLDQAQNAQLLVVGSRGRGAVAGKLLGSVSAAVVQASRTPLIVARRQLLPASSPRRQRGTESAA